MTLEQARKQLRLVASGSPESHPDDSFLEDAIAAAREQAENFTRLTLIETEFEWTFDAFPRRGQALTLPRNPALAVSEIAYTDTDGAAQTFADFVTDFGSHEALVAPEYGKLWPTSRGHLGDVTITFTAGFPKEPGSPDDYRANVPASIQRAMLFLIGHMYENRESVAAGVQMVNVPQTFESLLWPHRSLHV